MTRLLLITENGSISNKIDPGKRSTLFAFDTCSAKQIRKSLSDHRGETLCYVDINSYTTDIRRLLKEFAEHPTVRIGVLDPKNAVDDPAELFHAGAVDYIGAGLLKKKVSTNRFKSVLAYRPMVAPDPEPVAAATIDNLVPTTSWDTIETGTEYTFAFLYVEIDLVEEWQRKSGKDHLNAVMSEFHKHIERETAPLDGRVWMWMERGGIVLLPFDGTQCNLIETCMKLILDRTIISAEYYTYNTKITYRMAIHIGNTIYRSRGKTGTLVSDTVNFVFHLGQKFVKPGNLYVTETAKPFIPHGLSDCFVPAGRFEEVDILRMRLPVSH